jgi:branched-chain amino acid aminotransferase
VPVETMMTADEAFTVGTAVVISPIGEAVHEGKTHTLLGDKGPITQDLYQTLVDIQTGAGEDKHGWTIFLD